MSSSTELKPPEGWVKGMVPTMNDTGFMFERIDEYAEDFIEYAGNIDDEVLELGCAYGVTTIKALEAGARVFAADLDQRHLDIMQSRVPGELKGNLRCQQAALPDATLPENHFGAIFCSRVLHFLRGDDVSDSVRNMYRWMKPGGRLYLITDTPYGIWRAFIPTWEANKANNERWPGLMEPAVDYLPYKPTGRTGGGPKFLNLMDTDLLSRICREAGFSVERATFISRPDFGPKGRMDGRENCGCLAVKPT
jgi:SAM-dependent methyltransferase